MRQLQNKIDKEYTQIGYFILALIMLRPTFYFYNYYLGRLSDLISIFLLFASIIFFHKTFEKKKIKIFLLWLGSYFVCLSISYFINNFSFILQIKDFVEWFRPIMLFLALLFGYAFFKSFKQFIGLNKLIIMISLISSMIAIFEYLNKGDIFYFLFSGPNLFEQRRPGGIAYSHVEYSFLSLLGFVSSVYLFFISKRKIYRKHKK